MAEPQSHTSDQGTSAVSDHGRPAVLRLPPEEIEQPDPMLALSTGRMGAGGISLVVLAIIVILGIVFYAMIQ